jgi:hypothetical protein
MIPSARRPQQVEPSQSGNGMRSKIYLVAQFLKRLASPKKQASFLQIASLNGA